MSKQREATLKKYPHLKNYKFLNDPRGNRAAQSQRFRDKYPEKNRAYQKLYRYIKIGKIIKPKKCNNCGFKDKHIHGHHEDYKKPLQVLWLCHKCHNNIHGKNKTKGGNHMIKRLVLELDESTHRRFKKWCVDHNLSMRLVLTRLIKAFMKGKK